jgi:dTMP kinase
VVARAETLLMLAARAQHVEEVIAPTLASGRDVVCDRFSGSTIAYQGYGRGLDPSEVASLSRWAAGGLEPDLNLLLRVPADVAMARRSARAEGGAGPDRIEGEPGAFFARVDAGFEALAAADPGRWRVIDGSGPVAAVAARVADAVG